MTQERSEYKSILGGVGWGRYDLKTRKARCKSGKDRKFVYGKRTEPARRNFHPIEVGGSGSTNRKYGKESVRVTSLLCHKRITHRNSDTVLTNILRDSGGYLRFETLSDNFTKNFIYEIFIRPLLPYLLNSSLNLSGLNWPNLLFIKPLHICMKLVKPYVCGNYKSRLKPLI